MCGRFSLTVAETDIRHHFAIEKIAMNLPRCNISPSQDILAIRAAEAGRQGVLMRWGLIPGWVKNLDDWASNLINARAETIFVKPSFKNAFKARPCLIPASGSLGEHSLAQNTELGKRLPATRGLAASMNGVINSPITSNPRSNY